MKHFWIIDNEFASYNTEKNEFLGRYPDCEIYFSKEITVLIVSGWESANSKAS